MAGVPPQTSSQPGHEAGHSRPQLGPVLPPGRHGRVHPDRHPPHRDVGQDNQKMLLEKGETRVRTFNCLSHQGPI